MTKNVISQRHPKLHYCKIKSVKSCPLCQKLYLQGKVSIYEIQCGVLTKKRMKGFFVEDIQMKCKISG